MRPRVGPHVAPRLLKRDSGGVLRILRPHRTNGTPRHQGPDLLPERDGRQTTTAAGRATAQNRMVALTNVVSIRMAFIFCDV